MVQTSKLAQETKERNFPCNFCDFKAVDSSGLKRHISEYLKNLKKRKFDQKICINIV